jgi:ABC-2 type transport system permease protein
MSDAKPVPPTLWRSSVRIFELSFGQMLWSRRSIFLALLTGGPVVLAVMVRVLTATMPSSALRVNGAAVSGPAIFGIMIWLLYVRFIVPVLGVFYGTALIADEVEDKTLTYLFTRPIPRGAVILGKYFAYLVCTVLLLLPSVTIIFFLIASMGGASIGRQFPALLSDLALLAIGLTAYGALFALVGARLKRPLVIGLVFIFGWEPGVLIFPGYLKQLTVAFYLQALVPHAMPDDGAIGALMQIFREIPTLGASLAALAGITAAALWLAVRSVETKEYVLEQ